MKEIRNSDRYMSTLTIGAKGQIVIPKEIRDMFGLSAGDSLVILADKKRGIALQKMSVLSKLADAILGDSLSGEDEKTFADNLKKIGGDIE